MTTSEAPSRNKTRFYRAAPPFDRSSLVLYEKNQGLEWLARLDGLAPIPVQRVWLQIKVNCPRQEENWSFCFRRLPDTRRFLGFFRFFQYSSAGLSGLWQSGHCIGEMLPTINNKPVSVVWRKAGHADANRAGIQVRERNQLDY
jgi:hypothetical protein